MKFSYVYVVGKFDANTYANECVDESSLILNMNNIHQF